VVFVVVASVGELLLEALADEEPVVGVDCQVSGVEKGMEVGAEQQAVANLVPSPVGIRPDVSGF
jgi:Ni,Fe-hydrogenase maturation factor